jgi:hypothetical protein
MSSKKPTISSSVSLTATLTLHNRLSSTTTRMTNQPDSVEEAKTSNQIQQGEPRLSSSARTPVELFQVHGERRRRLTEEEERQLLLEIVDEATHILEDNADLYHPSSAGELQQPSE